MFLIEGVRELSRALTSRREIIDTVFFCDQFFRDNHARELISQAGKIGLDLCRVSKEVFEKISNREHCDGVIALANFWDVGELKIDKNSLVLVAEGIEKSGNLGALMRSAEAAGVNSLILCDPVTDIFNPSVVRASQGAVFSLPISVMDNRATWNFLKKHEFKLFAATPNTKNWVFNENFNGNCAIIVGSEHDGLSDFWLRPQEVKKISLPQFGICDSLNVNDAAVVILYEALRQRLNKHQNF